MLVLIDNYDSFVHNLARYLRRLGQETLVLRNDATDAARLLASGTQAVVLSPGPCGPDQAGCSVEVVRRLSGQVPILGVCLGHQCIGAAFGGRIGPAPEPVHGRCGTIYHQGHWLFQGIPSPFPAGRYHSLVIRPPLPKELEVIAWLEDGTVMGVAHREHLTVGVQFHPESVLTEVGYRLLANFLRRCGLEVPEVPQLAQEFGRWLRPGVPLPQRGSSPP